MKEEEKEQKVIESDREIEQTQLNENRRRVNV